MKKRGTWQVAGTLSREASMFAYGATPRRSLTDPFFTQGVSRGAVKLLASARTAEDRCVSPNFKRYPAFLETAKKNYKMLVDGGVLHGTGTDSGPSRTISRILRTLGAGAHGRRGAHATTGPDRRHAPRRRMAPRSGSRHAGGVQMGGLRGARRRPVGGHQEHQADPLGATSPAQCGTRPSLRRAN